MTEQKNLSNVLHFEGEQYILAAAFNTAMREHEGTPEFLYVGIDNRETVTPAQTLTDVVAAEPTLGSYQRAPISTKDGFASGWVRVKGKKDDSIFILNRTLTFRAEGGDIGRVKHYFLTTAAQGANGKLIMTTPMKKPFDFDEDWSIKADFTISLREAELPADFASLPEG